MAEVQFQNKKIAYQTCGSGSCLVLLHGYLETKAVWNNFIKYFHGFKIITPDLPGHGDSEVLSNTHTMEQMAQSVAAILEVENVEKCIVYGHSMGGYVALAFERLFPHKTLAIGLLHSTIYADAPEKQSARMREIELIEAGKQSLIISGMMPRIVAPQNMEQLKPQLETIMTAAQRFSTEGIVAALRGMIQRPEHVVNKTKPLHLIGGKYDQFIPVSVYEKTAKDNPSIVFDCVEDVGHASFIENPKEAADVIKKFLHSVGNIL